MQEKQGQITLDLVEDLKRVYHSNLGKLPSDKEATAILRALLSLRDTRKIVSTHPRHLFQVVFENNQFYGKSFLPCDVIQLREIMKSGRIEQSSNIVLFSNQAYQKLIKTYKVILVLKIDPAETDAVMAGGLAVLPRAELDIKSNILSIIVQRDAPYEEVERIVSEYMPECPIHDVAYVPAIDVEKFAQSREKGTLYLVNLPQLQVYRQKIRATSPFNALEIALIRRWSHYHEKDQYKKRPGRFRAEFWQESPFFDSIVVPIEKGTKTAAAAIPQIHLTDQEQQIFSVLLDINSKMNLGITFRVAGGWVRDKLLGTPSDDIDIALDKMTGQQFVQYAFKYKEMNPQAPLGKTYVVDQNVEKSKHLETTALEIAGLKIDFVNLRDESYGDSRVPTMKLSDDPKVDAMRRDLTINSLFYNVNTGQVEDYVGGMQDLETMTLRTPMEPTKTFLDDPLRVLRLLRFHAKYPNSTVAPEVVEAMKRPEVHDAYRKKVSPERAGPEILKLFSGKNPHIPLLMLYDTGFDAALLDMPEFNQLHPFAMDQRNPHHEFNVRDHTFKVMEEYAKILDEQVKAGVVSPKDRMLAMIGCWFHDYGKLHPEIGKPKEDNPNHWTYIGHEDKSAELSEAFLKRIGIGQDDRQFVNVIVQEHMTPHGHGSGNDWNKRNMGKFREKTIIPGQDRTDLWKFIIWHAKADDAAKGAVIDPETQKTYDDKFQAYHDYISAPPPMKPLLNGQELMTLFNDLDPKSGFINYVNGKLKEMQSVADKNAMPSASNVVDVDSARMYVNTIAPEVRQKFLGLSKPIRENKPMNNPQPPKQANWYQKVKTADASSAGPVEGLVGYDETALGEQEDIKHMIYYTPGQNSLYREKDRVRDRRGRYGEVVKVNGDNTVSIRWDHNKDAVEKYDLSSEAPALFHRV